MRQKVSLIYSEKACWIFQADPGQKCLCVKNPGNYRGFQKAPAGSCGKSSALQKGRVHNALSFVHVCMVIKLGQLIWPPLHLPYSIYNLLAINIFLKSYLNRFYCLSKEHFN